ncbi:hypothetical protein AB0O90_07755 [Microbacterium testaceum]|uniref:hypothetical protein n=1 Tax=Microbacterium testaceum TaxID=2033 RepID=UPI00342113C9
MTRNMRAEGAAVLKWFAQRALVATPVSQGPAVLIVDESEVAGVVVRRLWHTALTIDRHRPHRWVRLSSCSRSMTSARTAAPTVPPLHRRGCIPRWQPFEMDAWGRDAATAGQHTCLGGMSGSGPISFSDSAVEVLRSALGFDRIVVPPPKCSTAAPMARSSCDARH